MTAEGTGRPTRRERRQAATRNDLIDATLAVIKETGAQDLSAVTIGRVLAEAEVARATLYAYFPDGREGLLRAAYERVAHQFLGDAKKIVDSKGGQELQWSRRMAAYAEALLNLSIDPGIGYFYNVSGAQLQVSHKERGVGATGVLAAFQKELQTGRPGSRYPGSLAHALAVLLAGSLRDAGIEVALRPDRAPELLSAFRLLLAKLAEPCDAGRVQGPVLGGEAPVTGNGPLSQ